MFDSHAHVADPQLASEAAAVFERAQAAGVAGWIEIGTTVAESRAAIAVAEQFATVWASVGVHPNEIAGLTEEGWQELELLLQHEQVVAIGEVGVDLYREGDVKAQVAVLARWLSLARQVGKPVVFHVRDGEQNAHEELLTVLEAVPAVERPAGVIHTFSGTASQAERYIALGLHLSFSGVVTFKNAGVTAEVATTVPLNRLLVETDCPYLAPEPYRGKRNEPAYVQYVVEKIAELRGLSREEVVAATDANTQRLFQVTF